MGESATPTGLEFLLQQQDAITLFLDWAQKHNEAGEDSEDVPPVVAELDQAFSTLLLDLSQEEAAKQSAKTISSLEEELAATKHALREMFKKYKESERDAAFKKVDLDNIHRSMLITELGRSKSEAATAQKLAEERVSEMWSRLSEAEDEIADLEEELLTMRVKHAELLRENEVFKLGQNEAEQRALARRIALYPIAADPHIAAAIKSRLIVRLQEKDGRAQEVFQPKVDEDTQFDQEGKFSGRLTADTDGDATANPFVDDYDDNEDSVVRYFTEPILPNGENAPTHSAGEDRLLPDRGELSAPVMVEMEIELPDGTIEKRVVTAPPMEEENPKPRKLTEDELTDQLVHELGIKTGTPKIHNKPKLPPPPANRRNRRL